MFFFFRERPAQNQRSSSASWHEGTPASEVALKDGHCARKVWVFPKEDMGLATLKQLQEKEALA